MLDFVSLNIFGFFFFFIKLLFVIDVSLSVEVLFVVKSTMDEL